jgi:putative phosphoesterase
MPSASTEPRLRVGLISDTHGLLRPEALACLQGSDFIIHAGDIGDAGILEALGTIAPVTAVRGNNDTAAWARKVPHTAVLRAGGAAIYVIHDVAGLDIDPAAEGMQAVVAGHSHKPSVERRGGVLFVNPGSAGPRRFTLPVSAGRLTVHGREVDAELLGLAIK